MSFEKSFPSLHNAETTGSADDEGNNQYNEQDIENYCLDRQKVREAIIRHFNKCECLRVRGLLKELGLDDEVRK